MAIFLLAVFFVSLVVARDFTYYDYHAIVDKILELESQHPNLVKVTTAQDLYGLDSAGSCGDVDCMQYIVHLTNFETYEDNKATRPEVFLSGCLHGDERVGPTTIVETIQLLTENYESGNNAWLRHLVDTRSVFMMPASNALGYFQNSRTENGIDPNRDFPFDRPDEDCMNTITARAINELWRDHMFQLSITFHSGIRMIGYEWGDTTNGMNYTSPDQNAQAAIGGVMSSYAGTFSDKTSPRGVPFPELYDRYTYPQGPITPLLYPVSGGFEDYAYASNWAPHANVCRPRVNGEYPVEKTQYTDAQLRAFNVLVESDEDKEPSPATLGTTEELLKPSGKGQGHIPRHVRIVLTTLDVVQPYIKFVGFTTISLLQACSLADVETDIQQDLTNHGVNEEYFVIESPGFRTVSISYEVGGSFEVDSTSLTVYRKPSGWDPDMEITDDVIQDLREFEVTTTDAESGYTRWSGGGVYGSTESQRDQNIYTDFVEVELSTTNDIDDREKYPFIPAWKHCFVTPEEPGEYLVIARARVDQAWARVPANATPADYAAQAHLTQARTNTTWVKENNGFVIAGKTTWYSQPLELVVLEEDVVESVEETKFDELMIGMISLVSCLGFVMLFGFARNVLRKIINPVVHMGPEEEYRASL